MPAGFIDMTASFGHASLGDAAPGQATRALESVTDELPERRAGAAIDHLVALDELDDGASRIRQPLGGVDDLEHECIQVERDVADARLHVDDRLQLLEGGCVGRHCGIRGLDRDGTRCSGHPWPQESTRPVRTGRRRSTTGR
jgi:hypothetical protein